MNQELTNRQFIISLGRDRILMFTGCFFLLVALCFVLPLIGLIFLRLSDYEEWWSKLLFCLFLAGVILLYLNALAKNAFLWLVFGKEIITLNETGFVLERTRGFSPFQKHIVPYHTISDISLSKKVDYFEYTGKVETGVLRIKYDKDKNIGFGGRKINETISAIYQTIQTKSKI